MRFIILTIAIALLSINNGFAQYYSSGEAPQNIKWQQIKTQNFNLIFPSYYASKAKQLAAIVDTARKFTTESMGRPPKKINIMVHAQSAYSNGFVTWAPKRMELYPMPPQDGTTQNWLEHLVTHEYRHLVQIDQLEQGSTKWMGYLFGQQATGAMIGIHFPMWFLEGDCVLTETLLSEAGRGRMPGFSAPLRAQLITHGKFSYDKAYLGSYKDEIPNYYVMGYHFVTGARQMFKQDIWKNVSANIGANSLYPLQFNRQIKKETGFNKTELYNIVFDSLTHIWHQQTQTITEKSSERINKPVKNYRNYLYPSVGENGKIIALIDGPSDIAHIVEIDSTGNEKKIKNIGYIEEGPISYANGFVTWSELKRNVRWSNASRQVIKLMHVETKKIITYKEATNSLTAPALSSDATQLVAVELDNKNRSAIVIIDRITGEKRKLTNRFDGLIINPVWTNSNQIAYIVQTQAGKQIISQNIETHQQQILFISKHQNIRHLQAHNTNLLFTLAQQGHENVMMLSKNQPTPIQITSEKYGAASPTISNNKLIYSQLTSSGYQLAKTDTQAIVNNNHLPNLFIFNGLEKHELGQPNFANADTSQYKITPYSKWHLFNVHSWAPAFVNLNNESIHQGLSLMSQNMLGTMYVEAGYNADKQYETEKFQAKVSYKGWFPQINLTVKVGDSKNNIDGLYQNGVDTFRLVINATQNYYQVLPGISIPLNFSSTAWSRSITPMIRYTYFKQTGYTYEQTRVYKQNNRYYYGPTQTLTQPDFEINGLEYDLFGYNLRQGSKRDVATRMGQVAELNYRHTPWGEHDRGTQLAILTRLYWPGIGSHHAISIENNAQIRTDGEISSIRNGYAIARRFTSVVQLPRGYGASEAQKIYSLRTNYTLPLLNPDYSLGGLIYIKRITANLFFDFSHTNLTRLNTNSNNNISFINNYKSFGGDLLAEFHPFRFILPLKAGIRIAHLPNTKSNYSEFLLNLNVNGFLVNSNR